MSPEGGSGGWLGEKKLFFLFQMSNKAQKQNGGGSDPNMDNSIFFLFF